MRKLGMTASEFEKLIDNGDKSNANIGYSPELVSWYTFEATSKEYALQKMPEDCAEAHKSGHMHIHDLSSYYLRPNCFTMSLDWIARNGVKIDGVGLNGSVAAPAKSLEVLLNHALQCWMALATVLSGGVGFNNFNIYLAPFARGKSYEEVKQAIQSFIFNCNMSLVCRGGQVLFSSIGVDMSIPDVLKDTPAVAPGGIAIGVYGEYEEEAYIVFRAICEVIQEHDANGRQHRYPNVLFNIRDGDLDEYKGNARILHELAVTNPQIYFCNCTSLERSTMGCRSSLPMNYTGDYFKDCTNTGNFQYVTLNLPLYSLKADGDVGEFYRILEHYCDLARKSLLHRRDVIKDVLYEKKMSNFLLQEDVLTGEPLYDLERTTITLGFCGLNEALIALYGEDIVEAKDKGEEILRFINEKKDEYARLDGLRWSVIGSPAESAAHRFATINSELYPYAPVQGVDGSYYLTNSSHISVGHNGLLAKHIVNADTFHNYTLGGNILHLWLGEAWSDPVAYFNLNRKILETNTIFWAYSKVYTFCNDCHFSINDDVDVCPVCNSTDLQVWDRITGYQVPRSQYNRGKLQEQSERYRHSM